MQYIYLFMQRAGCLLLIGCCCCTQLYAQGVLFKRKDTTTNNNVDTSKFVLNSRDTTGYFPNNELYLQQMPAGAVSCVDLDETKKLPYTGINQMLIGRTTGVDVRIPTSEPGKRNSLFIRGTSSLLLKNSDLFYAQPTYVVDGVPLILDHAFAYDIQRFDFNRLGTETDLLSVIDVNDIERIEVLKDFAATARYGPMAANGVINIVTKGPRIGKMKVSVNSWAGVSVRPKVDAVNGRYERDFRLPFYNKYANETQWLNFPRYLADSSQPRYFGPANWDDLFYRNSLSEGIQAAVSGGSAYSAFRFGIGQTSRQDVADMTGLQRYNVNFGINIMPVHNLLFTAYMGVATLNRKRNELLRDRAGDEDYLFNYENPLSPNKDFLQPYYTDKQNIINRNRNNSARIIANAQYTLDEHFTWNTRFAIDYGQNFRDYFLPASLGEGNSFVSDFDGLNRRLLLDNSVRYANTFGKGHGFTVTLGQYDQWDKWRYDYGRAYKGKSDYIKIYQPGNDANHQGQFSNFRLTFNAKDFTQSNLASFYGNIDYNYQQKYFLGVYIRRDGTSYLAPENQWLTSPTFSAAWKISNEAFFHPGSWLNQLELKASWGRVGRLLMDELYRGGPVYNVDEGWNGTPNISTYNAFPGLNAAYGTGYVINGTKWPYVDQLNGEIYVSLLKSRLNLTLDVYSKTDRNLVLKVPVMEEEGYTGVVRNGMAIRNYGYELAIDANIVNSKQFGWNIALTAYTNQNKLLALPEGLQDLTIDNHRFLVGKPTDRYWVLENQGIYNSDAEVPVNPATGKKQSYLGVALQAGDPKWKDQNGDYNIDNGDRIMTGRLSPAVTGGFSNTFRYRALELNLLLNYAFGRHVINEVLANRFDFANREGVDDPKGIKEISYWTKIPGDYSKIPLYNPWSAVYAYQPEQTLFLENASYVKLRSVTLTYNFQPPWLKKAGVELLRIYATGNNLLTWTKYKGGDPETVSYFGYDEGYYNWAYPRTYTLGFNFQF